MGTDKPIGSTILPAVGGKRLPPAAGMGRKKGVPNKVTRTAKDAIALAGERLGGATRLVAWVKEDPKNEHAFWSTIYPKLIPVQVVGDPNNPLVTSLTVTFK